MTINKSNLGYRIRLSPKARWIILGNVAMGMFMSTLDSSIVNVALPTLSLKLHSDLSTLQWVITAYLLTIASLLPVMGRVADLIGRKRVFSLGLLIFGFGSALCGLSNNIWFLVAMRVVQALGSSMIMANSAAIIIANFPPEERGRSLGLIGTIVALGALTGPSLGGFLVSTSSWRAIFYVNVPIAIIGYIITQIVLPADNLKQVKEDFDFKGAFLFGGGMLTLLLAINNGQDWGWVSTPILAGLVAGLILLGLFLVAESRVRSPLIDLSLYKIKPFLIGNVTGFIMFLAMASNNILMPFYLQHVLYYGTSEVGLIMTAFPLTMLIVAPISGYLSDRSGPVFLTTGGLFLVSIGLFYMSTLSVHSTAISVIPGTILMAFGAGMFQSPNSSSVMSSVPEEKLGVVGGINALVRNVAMVIGIALSVSLFESRNVAILSGLKNPSQLQITDAFVRSYHTVVLVGAVIALIGALVSVSRKGY